MGSHASPICSTLSLSLPIMFPGWVPMGNTVSILEGSISSFWVYAAGFSAVLASRGIMQREGGGREQTNKQTKKERNSERGNVNNQNGGKDDVSIYCPVAREKKRKTEKTRTKEKLKIIILCISILGGANVSSFCYLVIQYFLFCSIRIHIFIPFRAFLSRRQVKSEYACDSITPSGIKVINNDPKRSMFC